MSYEAAAAYLKLEISGSGTIEVRGTPEFVDALRELFVSGIALNVEHRAQRKGVRVQVETTAQTAATAHGSKRGGGR